MLEKLEIIELSSAGLPVFLEGEVNVKSEANISIENVDKKAFIVNVTLILSNIKIYFISREGPGTKGYTLKLSEVKVVEDCSTFFSTSKRLRILFFNNDDIYVRFETNKEKFLGALQQVLLRKSWLHIVIKPEKSNANNPSQPPLMKDQLSNLLRSDEKVGVAAVKHKQAQEHIKVESLAKDSLDDINSLMSHARDVVTIIKKYSSFLQNIEDSKQSQNEDMTQSEYGDSVIEMESILQSIGLISPVTKLSAGRLFHEQLARQIADLLLKDNRLQRLGGIITLTDLYCLYNRARGSELISPSDVVESCRLLKPLNLGVMLYRFKSGVLTVQLASLDEDTLCKNLVTVIESYPDTGVHPTFVSKYFSVSMTVAKEMLYIAESRGELCRDETVDGVYFFLNHFKDF